MKISSRGFTLMELIIVIAILGILLTALVPGYNSYIQKGRDAARVTDVGDISKASMLHFTEYDKYATSDAAGCVNYAALLKYFDGSPRYDPLSNHSNGCSTLGSYGYAMSTGIVNNPNIFSVLAIMEQPNGGNYGGGLSGFTGLLSLSAYNTGLTLLSKGSGPSYILLQ